MSRSVPAEGKIRVVGLEVAGGNFMGEMGLEWYLSINILIFSLPTSSPSCLHISTYIYNFNQQLWFQPNFISLNYVIYCQPKCDLIFNMIWDFPHTLKRKECFVRKNCFVRPFILFREYVSSPHYLHLYFKLLISHIFTAFFSLQCEFSNIILFHHKSKM